MRFLMEGKMSNKIVNWLIGLFGVSSTGLLGKYLLVFFISLMPILELRGGLVAAALLKLPALPSYLISILGNIIPIPFILWFLDAVFDFMKKHNILTGFVSFCERKGNEKKDKIEKLGFLGLVLFVGLPLPGTGAWTGCLIATILRMDKKKAFLAAILGVLMASVIMMLVSYGVLANIF